MMWDTVMTAWVALMDGDALLTTALGGQHTYAAPASRPVRIPSVEWLLIGDLEEESFNPITAQIDLFAKSVDQAAAIERRIRVLTHRDVARDLGAHRMWTRYLDSRNHDYPATPGVVHRSLDFLFEPLREVYA